jgi:hypothetical protein
VQGGSGCGAGLSAVGFAPACNGKVAGLGRKWLPRARFEHGLDGKDQGGEGEPDGEVERAVWRPGKGARRQRLALLFQRAIAVAREGKEEGKEADEDPYPKANLRRQLAVTKERRGGGFEGAAKLERRWQHCLGLEAKGGGCGSMGSRARGRCLK